MIHMPIQTAFAMFNTRERRLFELLSSNRSQLWHFKSEIAVPIVPNTVSDGVFQF